MSNAFPLNILKVIVVFLAISSTMQAQTNFFWVGGDGDWDDINHWFKDEQGNFPAGALPNDGAIVYLTKFSHTGNAWTLTIPPGSHEAHSIINTSTKDVDIVFDGTSGNLASMTIYNDLQLTDEDTLKYNVSSVFANSWTFDGDNDHLLSTGDDDLLNVHFKNENGTYDQLSTLYASKRIRMHGGTWNTNGYDVQSETLQFDDDNGSSNPLDKTLNASTSELHCDTWTSRFAYQSLVVNGNYKIFTKQFLGSPGTPFLSFHYNEIHLLDFEDDHNGSTSQIEHNNFDCAFCVVEQLIIHDQSRVQLADIFTIEQELNILSSDATILFNGGNGRDNEVIMNGIVTTPNVSECSDRRVVFASVFSDFTEWTRTSGNLTVNDVELENIKAQGGASFTANHSVLKGSSIGWNISNPPVPLEYVWIGNTGTLSNWSDPTNWSLSNGGYSGCVPRIIDNVLIDQNAKGGIRIGAPYQAYCHNLDWKNTDGFTLQLDGQILAESELFISGDLYLDPSANIEPINNHEFILASTGNHIIESNGIQLPDIYFWGELGHWTLTTELNCDQLYVESGTLNTNNQKVKTDNWLSIDSAPKHFIFGSSIITVNGNMSLAPLPNNNVTVDFGTSTLVVEQLTSAVPQLYDVKMINTTNVTMDNWPTEFNSLILSGTGTVSTIEDITVENLVFDSDNSTLRLGPSHDFKVNGEIISNAAKVTPGILMSTSAGTQAELLRDQGNLCVQGYISFQDINASFTGTMHAPLGFDLGNNSGITFDGNGSAKTLYWTGEHSLSWMDEENWSFVSGGCPAYKDPSSQDSLVFDDQGKYSTQDTIFIGPGTVTAQAVTINASETIHYFVNSALHLESLDIENSLVYFHGLQVLGLNRINVGNNATTGALILRCQDLVTPLLKCHAGSLLLNDNCDVLIWDN